MAPVTDNPESMQPTRGADTTAPRFALRTMRAKAHAHVKLSRPEALRYLGYSGQTINEELTRRLDKWALACENELSPTYTWRAFAIDEERTSWEGEPAVALQGCNLLLEGNSIATHLRGAHFAACFAATLGLASERALHSLGATNPLDAILYDACCNALIEAVAQAAQEDIAAEAEKAGLFARMRFSPGYGDLPLAVQPRFIEALDAQKLLGLSVNSSLLLVPAKSVTAVVGLFSTVPQTPARTPCQDCIAREYCSYLEKGITCYGNHH